LNERELFNLGRKSWERDMRARRKRKKLDGRSDYYMVREDGKIGRKRSRGGPKERESRGGRPLSTTYGGDSGEEVSETGGWTVI